MSHVRLRRVLLPTLLLSRILVVGIWLSLVLKETLPAFHFLS